MLVDKEEKKCDRRMVQTLLGWNRGQCRVLNPAAVAEGEALWEGWEVGRRQPCDVAPEQSCPVCTERSLLSRSRG